MYKIITLQKKKKKKQLLRLVLTVQHKIINFLEVLRINDENLRFRDQNFLFQLDFERNEERINRTTMFLFFL